MKLKEIKSGVQFMYGNGSYYNLEEVVNGSWIICQFGRYIASVEKMTSTYIYAYTFIMDERVDLKINISKCTEMKQREEVLVNN